MLNNTLALSYATYVLVRILKKKLATRSVDKIKQLMFEKYGNTLDFVVNNDFDKVMSILVGQYDNGACVIREEFEHVMSQIQQYPKCDNRTMVIDEPKWTGITQIYNDQDSRNIVKTVMAESKVIATIINECNLSQSSGYRKINRLIDFRLLLEVGYVMLENGIWVSKYTTPFDKIKNIIIKDEEKIVIRLKHFVGNEFFPIPKII